MATTIVASRGAAGATTGSPPVMGGRAQSELLWQAVQMRRLVGGVCPRRASSPSGALAQWR
eukprot:5589476-Lingulodinium_polyedra.AAC.1